MQPNSKGEEMKFVMKNEWVVEPCVCFSWPSNVHQLQSQPVNTTGWRHKTYERMSKHMKEYSPWIPTRINLHIINKHKLSIQHQSSHYLHMGSLVIIMKYRD